MIYEDEFDKAIIDCINETAKGYSRQCARSAIHHLKMAWKIRDIDPEMAVFRSITAEEEAATAVFISLKELGYEGAEKIQFRNHSYKQALEPFIQSIFIFAEKTSKEPDFPFGKHFKLHIEGTGKAQRLLLSFEYSDRYVIPIPPLGFSIKSNGKPYLFERELLEITSSDCLENVLKHIKNAANLRNQLIYAQSRGIPKIDSNIDQHLRHAKKVVFIILRVFCLIFPYQERALFVQQALNAFLTMMGVIESINDQANC